MRTTSSLTALDRIPDGLRAFVLRRGAEVLGLGLVVLVGALALALLTWSVQDPSFNHATSGPVRNFLGWRGAVAADLLMQMFGIAAVTILVPPGFWGWRLVARRRLGRVKARIPLWIIGGVAAAGLASMLPLTERWPLPSGLGGVIGDAVLAVPTRIFGELRAWHASRRRRPRHCRGLVRVRLDRDEDADETSFDDEDDEPVGHRQRRRAGRRRRAGHDRLGPSGRSRAAMNAGPRPRGRVRDAWSRRAVPRRRAREPAPWSSLEDADRIRQARDLAERPMHWPEPDPAESRGIRCGCLCTAGGACRAAPAERGGRRGPCRRRRSPRSCAGSWRRWPLR